MRRRLTSNIVRTGLVASLFGAALLSTSDAGAARRVGFFPPPGARAQKANASLPSPNAGTAGQCGVTTYCGGPVLSNAQVVPVFWTSGVRAAITSWAPGYQKALTNSSFMDMLSEYSTKGKTGEVCGMPDGDGGTSYFGPTVPFSTGQSITRGTGTDAVTITPIKTTGTSITDDNAAIGD